MKKTVIIFGLISGGISVGIMLGTIHYLYTMDLRKSDVLGYTSMVLSALLVFAGARSYREGAGGGSLSFGRGLAVGVLITLIASLCHVVAFQIIYFKAMPGIGEKYEACMIARAKISGDSPAEAIHKAQALRQLMDRPGTNAALSFAESFPVGLVGSLLSAPILRRKHTILAN